MRSCAVTLSAGELMAFPFTVTRPAAIQASASRREARPARAITLAMRSPDLSVFSAILIVRHGRACPGHPRLLCRSVYKDVDARHKAGHDGINGQTIFHADRARRSPRRR